MRRARPGPGSWGAADASPAALLWGPRRPFRSLSRHASPPAPVKGQAPPPQGAPEAPSAPGPAVSSRVALRAAPPGPCAPVTGAAGAAGRACARPALPSETCEAACSESQTGAGPRPKGGTREPQPTAAPPHHERGGRRGPSCNLEDLRPRTRDQRPHHRRHRGGHAPLAQALDRGRGLPVPASRHRRALPGHRGGDCPFPLRATGERYRGINVLSLWLEAAERGYSSPY